MNISKTAAFFDFDNTLLDGESAALGLKWAWENKQVSALYLLKVILANQLYKRDLVPFDFMTKLLLEYYRGRRLQYFVDTVEHFGSDWLKPHMSKEVMSKVEEHRSQGHLLVILSASVDYILNVVARELGFDRVLCTSLEVDAEGICTGRAEGEPCIGPHKRTAASALAEELDIDLGSSYAYSDHHSDLPLFELVGHPVAVRPTPRLRSIAEQRGWPIMERE